MTIVRQQDSKKPQKKYLILLGLLLTILAVFEIWANNTVVTYGERFENLYKLQKALQMENQILENDIAKLTSLSKIASRSASLGFSAPEEIEYIR